MNIRRSYCFNTFVMFFALPMTSAVAIPCCYNTLKMCHNDFKDFEKNKQCPLHVRHPPGSTQIARFVIFLPHSFRNFMQFSHSCCRKMIMLVNHHEHVFHLCDFRCIMQLHCSQNIQFNPVINAVHYNQ